MDPLKTRQFSTFWTFSFNNLESRFLLQNIVKHISLDYITKNNKAKEKWPIFDKSYGI